MKTALLCLMLAGCANKCPDCLTMTPAQLGSAMGKAWLQGYGKGFDAGEDFADKKQLRAL